MPKSTSGECWQVEWTHDPITENNAITITASPAGGPKNSDGSPRPDKSNKDIVSQLEAKATKSCEDMFDYYICPDCNCVDWTELTEVKKVQRLVLISWGKETHTVQEPTPHNVDFSYEASTFTTVHKWRKTAECFPVRLAMSEIPVPGYDAVLTVRNVDLPADFGTRLAELIGEVGNKVSEGTQRETRT